MGSGKGSDLKKLLIIFAAFLSLGAKAQSNEKETTYLEVHPWQRYTQGFRKEHHFSLSMGSGQGRWKVGHFGDLHDDSLSASSLWVTSQYSFHIQLWDGFGYFLGSSIGFSYEKTSSEQFDTKPSWHLPGLSLGLVYNQSPVVRYLVFQEVYLERMENLSGFQGDEHLSLDANLFCLVDVAVAMDYFFSLRFGLRLEAHYRKVFYSSPDNAEGGNLPEGARFEKVDQWVGLGLVSHMI